MTVAQSGSVEDHCRAISATLKIRPNEEWKRPPDRPRATWLRTVEKDLAPLHLGLHTAWRSAQKRITWSRIVRMLAIDDDVFGGHWTDWTEKSGRNV